MSLDAALHARLATSALLSGSTGGVALLLAVCSSDEILPLGAALAASVLLPLGRLFGLSAVVMRSTRRRGISLRQVILEILSFLCTLVSCCLFAASLGESESWIMSLALATVSQMRQPGRQGLSWVYFPPTATHRRVKAQLPWIVASSLMLTLFCMVLMMATSSFSFGSWLCTGLVVFASVELQEIFLEGIVGPSSAEGSELLEALVQPLSCEGPGLSRWLALAALAHAVVYRHQGQMLSKTTAFGYPMDIQPPAFAAQVFGTRSKAVSMSTSGLQAPDGRSFFAVYLQSGLEVLREFTIRVQCIVAASRHKGAKALDLSQLQVLEADVLQLAPLMRIAAAGLCGWICLSRDMDDLGKVQREDALSKVIYELCGALQALKRLISLRGLLDFAPPTVRGAQSSFEEAQHSLYQLLMTFEHCGLQQVILPPLYKRMLEDMMRDF
ncbi:unnamed protein product [Durusdinium trenchii]|uniref:Uncharacterized protein n=2 Tax=Durusdinium trenchii TaxID=1381693 RepID=A0ABP0KWK1_9DINO